MLNLIDYDICGVQLMTGATGQSSFMKSRFGSQNNFAEALFNEADTDFSVRDVLSATQDQLTHNQVLNLQH